MEVVIETITMVDVAMQEEQVLLNKVVAMATTTEIMINPGDATVAEKKAITLQIHVQNETRYLAASGGIEQVFVISNLAMRELKMVRMKINR